MAWSRSAILPPKVLSAISVRPKDCGSSEPLTDFKMVFEKLFHQLSGVRHVSSTFASG